MKKLVRSTFIVLVLLTVVFIVPSGIVPIQAAANPFEGKVIALDAGHGGEELGAQHPPDAGSAADVYEKDVNLAVVYVLKDNLEDVGAHVVLTRQCDEMISSRKERVDLALKECKSLYGKRCDILVSVHHNGSPNRAYDGLLVIYTEKRDLPLATALHDALWLGLTHNPNDYVDEGLNKGGYGMTVYGHLVSALTEAYYITNDWEAEQYLAGTSASVCRQEDGTDYSVLIGDRVNEEASALYQGLLGYFSGEEPTPDLGTIKGTVTDASTGARLGGVLVETDTGQSATTNRGGKYSINNVPVGSRTVTASQAGYSAQTKEEVTIVADQTTVVDFSLVPE